MNTRQVVQVIGPVVDIAFPSDAKDSDNNNALVIEKDDESTLTVEVSLSLGDGVVRTIAMDSTDGLRRGMTATDTGSINVPVGKATLGRVFNVLEAVDGGEALGTTQRDPIHRDAPTR